MHPDASDERRQHARAETEVTVVCQGMDADRLDAQNVSVGGLLLRSAVPLEVGQPLRLTLTLPAAFVPIGPSTLDLEAEVVRVERSGEDRRRYLVGVRFVDLTREQEESLAKYVRRRNLVDRRGP